MARTGRPRSVVLPMEEIRKLAAKGWCLRDIAEKYGCSRNCVMVRMKEAGIPRLPQWSQPGKQNGQWKGGRYQDADGYIYVYQPNHPFATRSGYVREHRLVMEKILGRYLHPQEVVHHKDGKRANNSPENLRVFSKNAAHLRYELSGKVPNWTENGKRRILQGVLRSHTIQKASSQNR